MGIASIPSTPRRPPRPPDITRRKFPALLPALVGLLGIALLASGVSMLRDAVTLRSGAELKSRAALLAWAEQSWLMRDHYLRRAFGRNTRAAGAAWPQLAAGLQAAPGDLVLWLAALQATGQQEGYKAGYTRGLAAVNSFAAHSPQLQCDLAAVAMRNWVVADKALLREWRHTIEYCTHYWPETMLRIVQAGRTEASFCALFANPTLQEAWCRIQRSPADAEAGN